MSSLESLLEFSLSATQEAGKITLEYFQTNLKIERKADQSPVTIADRRSEEKIREMIGRFFPNHGIVGEEFGETKGAGEYTWYIDPIDGTQAFVRGVPIYGVLLGLAKRNELVVGVAHMPALNETVSAAVGQGCYWNGRKASVSQTSQLRDAFFCHAGAEYFQETGRLEVYQKLVSETHRQRTWGDCYGHILVATGRADLCVDPILSPWDAAPMIPILKEAGGSFSDWKGKETIFQKEGISVNQKLRDHVLRITEPNANSI
jgi:histidinol phosphatase-like enzyme (inositol monophosphatase family)